MACKQRWAEWRSALVRLKRQGKSQVMCTVFHQVYFYFRIVKNLFLWHFSGSRPILNVVQPCMLRALLLFVPCVATHLRASSGLNTHSLSMFDERFLENCEASQDAS